MEASGPLATGPDPTIIGNPQAVSIEGPAPMRRTRDRRDALILAGLAIAAILGNIGWREPPRFDGAGYAVLARAIGTGAGYRAIDHPDRPPHVNFPPGYPLVLAAIWSVSGPSAPAAHAASALFSVGSTLLAWRWFRTQLPRRAAFWLAAALAVNWIGSRTGGEIQSEPLYGLLQLLALLLAASFARRRHPVIASIGLGLLLGAALLTRQVGVVLVAAVALDLALRRRVGPAILAVVIAGLVNAPWIAWQASHPAKKQLAYFLDRSMVEVATENALFYTRRLPDVLTGPFVEVATIFDRRFATIATAPAAAATLVILSGWFRGLLDRRRRLGSLVGLGTLAMLLVWPFTEAGRFLVPIIPMIGLAATFGSVPLLRRAGIRRPAAWATRLLFTAALPYSIHAIATGRAAEQRRAHDGFDAACAWIAAHGDRPGPILTAYPGEAFWQTGRTGVAPAPGDDADAVARLVGRYGVAYAIVTTRRFANAPPDPIEQLVARGDLTRPARIDESGVGIHLIIVRREPAE